METHRQGHTAAQMRLWWKYNLLCVNS